MIKKRKVIHLVFKSRYEMHSKTFTISYLWYKNAGKVIENILKEAGEEIESTVSGKVVLTSLNIMSI